MHRACLDTNSKRWSRGTLKQSVTDEDLKPPPVLWQEDNRRNPGLIFFVGRQHIDLSLTTYRRKKWGSKACTTSTLSCKYIGTPYSNGRQHRHGHQRPAPPRAQK